MDGKGVAEVLLSVTGLYKASRNNTIGGDTAKGAGNEGVSKWMNDRMSEKGIGETVSQCWGSDGGETDR